MWFVSQTEEEVSTLKCHMKHAELRIVGNEEKIKNQTTLSFWILKGYTTRSYTLSQTSYGTEWHFEFFIFYLLVKGNSLTKNKDNIKTQKPPTNHNVKEIPYPLALQDHFRRKVLVKGIADHFCQYMSSIIQRLRINLKLIWSKLDTMDSHQHE